jgi:hypothetical protein
MPRLNHLDLRPQIEIINLVSLSYGSVSTNPGIVQERPGKTESSVLYRPSKHWSELGAYFLTHFTIPQMEITNTNIAIESSSAKVDLCRLEHVSSTVSEQVLDEGLRWALEKTCNIESPANKKRKKRSWAFCEPAKVIMFPSSTIESSTSKVIGCLGGLTGDNRRAKIANMLQEATEMAQAVGNLDPEPESRSNGRRRFQRRNSFVIHRNRKNTGTFPAPATKITYPLNGIRNEANGALGPLPPQNQFVFLKLECVMVTVAESS